MTLKTQHGLGSTHLSNPLISLAGSLFCVEIQTITRYNVKYGMYIMYERNQMGLNAGYT